MSSRIARSLTIAVFAATLAACSSVPLDKNAGPEQEPAGNRLVRGKLWIPFNPQSPLAQQRSVYFEFNSYVVARSISQPG